MHVRHTGLKGLTQVQGFVLHMAYSITDRSRLLAKLLIIRNNTFVLYWKRKLTDVFFQQTFVNICSTGGRSSQAADFTSFSSCKCTRFPLHSLSGSNRRDVETGFQQWERTKRSLAECFYCHRAKGLEDGLALLWPFLTAGKVIIWVIGYPAQTWSKLQIKCRILQTGLKQGSFKLKFISRQWGNKFCFPNQAPQIQKSLV